MVSGYRILTHVDGVETRIISRPCTWATHFHSLQGDTTSPDPPLGVPWPLVRTPCLLLGPLKWKQVGSCNLLGWQEEVQGRSPLPTLVPEKSSSFPFVLCYINSFYSCHDNVEHTTLILAGLVLSCFTEVLRKHARCRAGRQGEGLLSASRDSRPEDHSSNSPAAHWLFAWSMCPAINSPGKPASLLDMLILVNRNDYEVDTWGVSRSPREVETPRGKEANKYMPL